MSKALEQASKTVKFNTRVIKTTTDKIVICGNLVRKPSNNNSLSTSVCANRIAIRNAIDSRRKSGTKIEIIHNQKVILCASKDGTFERENCYVTPLDGLTAGTLRVFELHGFTSQSVYRINSVSSRTKTPGREKSSPESLAIKELFHQEGGLQF